MEILLRAPARIRWSLQRRLTLRRRPDEEESVAGSVAKFALLALMAVLLIGVGGVVVIRRTASDEALRDAKEFARVAGRGIVAPHVTPAVLSGDRTALARLDRTVRQRILGGGVVRVKIWGPDGRIVYSDQRQLIGQRYRLGEDELQTMHKNGVSADASDLAAPENRYERRYHRLVEVYLSIHATNGRPLLFEDYERSSAITASSRRRWLSLAPALVIALIVLELVLVPLAWSMARRLRDRQRDRVALLRRAVASSELERRRIAADLHDGPLQRLASLAFDLSAEADMVPASAPGSSATALRAGAEQTRDTIRELRTLLVDIYPPTLREEGLVGAIDDLAAGLAADGVAVAIDILPALDLPDDVEALFFRVAQEALRNVRAHADARRVEISAGEERRWARLVVADDGRGFAPGDDGREGHFGLRLMQDLVGDAGGDLRVHSEPGHGTRVEVEVPLR